MAGGFPDGITRQYVVIRFTGHTQRAAAPAGESYKRTPPRELHLELDPGADAYDAEGIENMVLATLDDVQAALARERGEEYEA